MWYTRAVVVIGLCDLYSHLNQLHLTPPSQIISHAVLAKPGAPGQTVQARVLPVAGGQQRGGQQTIQVKLTNYSISKFWNDKITFAK